jgi:hypothetical protein
MALSARTKVADFGSEFRIIQTEDLYERLVA